MKKDKLISAFRTPVLSAGDNPHFEFNGNSELLVDGCEGILHYSDRKIRLNCGKYVVEIIGFELQLEHLGDKEASVRGKITSFNFI